MNAYARKLLLKNEIYDADKRLKAISELDCKKINEVIFDVLDIDRYALSKVVKK